MADSSTIYRINRIQSKPSYDGCSILNFRPAPSGEEAANEVTNEYLELI